MVLQVTGYIGFEVASDSNVSRTAFLSKNGTPLSGRISYTNMAAGTNATTVPLTGVFVLQPQEYFYAWAWCNDDQETVTLHTQVTFPGSRLTIMKLN